MALLFVSFPTLRWHRDFPESQPDPCAPFDTDAPSCHRRDLALFQDLQQNYFLERRALL